jgi:hypothetical protein
LCRSARSVAPYCARRAAAGWSAVFVMTSGKASGAGANVTAPPAAPAPQNHQKRTYADAFRAPCSRDDLPHGLLPRRRRKLSVAGVPEGRYGSILSRLFQREVGSVAAMATRASAAKLKFKNISLRATFDTIDGDSAHPSSLAILGRRRSRVIEIVSSGDLIFALTYAGVCAAYSRDAANVPICHMNTSSDEVIRSLFLNKSNGSLITVSVFRKDHFSSLHCRSTPLAHIRRGKLDSAVRIFESESLRWPGFVEFDDVNGKVLTFSAEDKKYKVWDLNTYDHLFTINDDCIQEIKISPGIMLLIHHRHESHVPLRIVDIETGFVVKDCNHLLHRNRKIDFIEQFNEKLLVKQEHENLQIVDVRTADVISVPRTHFHTPSAFIFLYENQLFLTFRQRQVSVWNFKGELVTTFEDHTLWYSDSHTNSIYITQHQDLIMSYCQLDNECDHGSINVSWITDGKRLAKISCMPNQDDQNHRRALEEVTALFYNEERNEIYSGNRQGKLHVWSS